MHHLTTNFKQLSMFASVASFIISVGLYMHFFASNCLFFYLVAFGIFGIFRHSRALNEEVICISDKTVEYRRWGSSFEARWEDIEKISKNWYLYRQDCLIIDKANIRILEMSFLGYGFLYNLFNLQEVFIPLSCFANDWRNYELGEQIKKHAPHLFQ
jgi:hypothetical protein